MATAADLYSKYIAPVAHAVLDPDNVEGAVDVAGNVGRNVGVQALSGIKGMSQMLPGGGDPADAVRAYQARYGSDQLGPAGQSLIRDLAPALVGGARSWPVQKLHELGQAYGEGTQRVADLAGKYLGPTAAGVVGAAGEAAPTAITPEGMLGERLAARALQRGVTVADPLASVAQHIVDNGGITLNPRTGEQPAAGFAVSTHPGRERILPQAPTPQDLRQYLRDNQDAFQADSGAHMGAWANDGKYTLDVTHNADPLSLKDENRLPDGSVDMSGYESAIRDAGYSGYHVPDGPGILRGQGRLFEPTPATRLGPGPAPPPEEDLSTGFADGGTVAGEALGDIGRMVARYAPEAEHLADRVATEGKVTYNPSTGDVPSSGYIVPTAPGRSVALDHVPGPDDIHSYLLQNQDAFDDPSSVLHVHTEPGGSFMHVAGYSPDFEVASDMARGTKGVQDIGTGQIHGAEPVVQPGTIVSGKDVIKHLQNIQPTLKLSEEAAREMAGPDSYGDYKLLNYPLDSIDADQPISSGKIQIYANKPTPFPAIVLNKDGVVKDGNHRIAAARLRRDQNIAAYVPVDSSTPPQDTNNSVDAGMAPDPSTVQ